MLTQWDTMSAASWAFQALSDNGGKELPLLRSALLRRQPLKRVSVFLWRVTLDIRCQPWLGPELAQRCPSTLAPEQRGGKGWPVPGKARRTQGLEPGRSQEQENAERELFRAPNLGSSSESWQLVSDTQPLGRKS